MEMLKRIQERNYFNPTKSVEVNEQDFLRILRGEVIKSKPFMIVGIKEGSPLESWAGQEWGVNKYELAHQKAIWYGKIVAQSQSRIIFPPKTWIGFNPNPATPLGRFAGGELKVEPWKFGGFMQLDKDLFYKTMVSNLSMERIVLLINQVYAHSTA
jgi:hypothetical protein